MKKNVYLQFDTVSRLYGQVIFDAQDPEDVKASFRAAARQGKIDHRTDDDEFYLAGTFDNRTGEFVTFLPPQFICRMKDYSMLADQLAAQHKEANDAGKEETSES